MSDVVIVALEPIEARCLAGEYIETMLEGEPVDFVEVENRAQAKLAAALDTDPEELEVRLARALYEANDPTASWDDVTPEFRPPYLVVARAVVAALSTKEEEE